VTVTLREFSLEIVKRKEMLKRQRHIIETPVDYYYTGLRICAIKIRYNETTVALQLLSLQYMRTAATDYNISARP